MDRIKAKKEEVLETLKENRIVHIAEYKEAIKGYRIKSAELLEKELSLIEWGGKFNMRFSINKPISYEADYDISIEMLEMDIEDIVTLTKTQFRNYIKDDWNWTDDFKMGNRGFSGYTGATGYSGTKGYTDITFGGDEL